VDVVERSCRGTDEVPIGGGLVTLRVDHRPGRAWLRGELDLSVAPEVAAQLEGLAGDIELDCSGLTFIDASGVRLFVAVHDARTRRGARLLIVNPSRCVLRLLELTGVGRLVGALPERSVS
jgi:anti-sigma B factor antagonist